MSSSYEEVYRQWQENPTEFWAKEAAAIDWFEPFDTAFDASQGIYGRWFPGALVNTCHNCVDRHVDAGRGDQAAVIYDSPITGRKATITYQDLLDDVSAFAAVLRNYGVGKGDRVIIYMPMIPQTIVATLACARLGAVHSIVFGGFAARELAVRIDDAKPKAIVAASCGIEPGRVIAYKPLLDDAIAQAVHKPDHTIVYQREELAGEMIAERDVDFAEALANAKAAGDRADCVPVASTDPLYILYTSGTTGVPKGVVRDNGGHLVGLSWTMENIYSIKPGEVFWAASDVGWVVGHSYIIYAPLINGCTSILFEGKPVGTPDAGVFWRVISEHNVAALFTAPTAFRAIKKEDPNGDLIKDYDLSAMRYLFLAGERADPDTIQWAEKQLDIPVIDHWWQTETGWTMAGNPAGLGLLPIKYGSPTKAMPGYQIDILSDEGEQLGAGELGNIAVKLPLPPGSFPTLWQNDARFVDAYLDEFPGYYKTADAGYKDEDGYLFIMARTDDIINVAGHRLSTGGMEEVIAAHPDVAECAVLGIDDSLKGQIPAGFIVLNSGLDRQNEEIEKEVIQLVRDKIGPVAAFKLAVTVDRLPKTRSGKILRGTIQKIANGQDYAMPATIDDPAILDEIAAYLRARGYGKGT